MHERDGKRLYWILGTDGEAMETSDLEAWHALMDSADGRIVARDVVDGATVCTDFVPWDMGGGQGPPVLWETMIFDGRHDGYQRRYVGRAEAQRGHAEVVARLRAGLSPDPG